MYGRMYVCMYVCMECMWHAASAVAMTARAQQPDLGNGSGTLKAGHASACAAPWVICRPGSGFAMASIASDRARRHSFAISDVARFHAFRMRKGRLQLEKTNSRSVHLPFAQQTWFYRRTFSLHFLLAIVAFRRMGYRGSR